ncbi:hypothetical protein RDL91_20530, partial [Mycobacterium sp. HOS88]
MTATPCGSLKLAWVMVVTAPAAPPAPPTPPAPPIPPTGPRPAPPAVPARARLTAPPVPVSYTHLR